MIRVSQASAFLVLCSLFGAGCSHIGDAPSGASTDDMRSAFEKLPPEEQAKTILSMPGSREGKETRIKEIYRKAGKTPPEDVFSLAVARGPGGPKS